MYRQIAFLFFLFMVTYVATTYGIKCYECQDVPPLVRNCSKMYDEGVVLSDCNHIWDACNTIVERVYNETILLRSCGQDLCDAIMGIQGIPGETFLSCQSCFEDGCNNVISM